MANNIEKLVGLSCLKCGSQNDLTLFNYSKRYKYTDGGAPFYNVYKGRNVLSIPTCYNCLKKINIWKKVFYTTIAMLILLSISYAIILSLSTIIFFNNLGLLVLIGLIIVEFLVFLMAHGSNPRLFSKFTVHSPYVRPVTSNKWVQFKIWFSVMLSTNSTINYNLKKIGYLTWRLPLIGGIIVLFSPLIPMYVYDFSGTQYFFWLTFFVFKTETGIIEFELLYIVSLNTLFYLIILLGSYLAIKQAYLLKRANTNIKGSQIILLGLGMIFLLITLYVMPIPITTSGPAIYGLLCGSILLIIGPLIEFIRNKSLGGE